MSSSTPFFRWIAIHTLAFALAPFCFMLAGILTGLLLSLEANSPSSSEPATVFDQAFFLLAPFLTGILLGALVSWVQIMAMRSSPVKVKPFPWIIPGMLGLALACLAFAWTFSSLVFSYPLLMAALFSACVYGLFCALPQVYLLRRQVEDSWRWLLFSLLAALLAIPLACAPVWLAEGSLYFWLVFPLAALGGVLFGLLTGFVFIRKVNP